MRALRYAAVLFACYLAACLVSVCAWFIGVQAFPAHLAVGVVIGAAGLWTAYEIGIL